MNELLGRGFESRNLNVFEALPFRVLQVQVIDAVARWTGQKGSLRVIHAATNKCESFNKFTKWLSFGGNATIQENDRDKQRKIIKYNHLVANCLIFHNVQSMSRVLRELANEGQAFDDEVLSQMNPYLTGHVNRFGKYALNMGRTVVSPEYQAPSTEIPIGATQ